MFEKLADNLRQYFQKQQCINTSVEAFEAAKPNMPCAFEKIVLFLNTVDDATSEEIASATGLRYNTVVRRVADLGIWTNHSARKATAQLRYGRLTRTGFTRKTSTGCHANCFTLLSINKELIKW